MFDTLPDVLSVQQLQKALDIGRNKAYDMLKSNQIKHIKMGGIYKIPKICLIEYIYSAVST